MMPEIDVQELNRLRINGANFQLLDVREPEEFERANLGGELIPIGELKGQLNRVNETGKIVVMCRSGVRSGKVVNYIKEISEDADIHNLKGGILAWKEEFNPKLNAF